MTREKEKQELNTMTHKELISYWNICQMNSKMIQSRASRIKNKRHSSIVKELLANRGLIVQEGQLITLIGVERKSNESNS